MSRIDFDPAVGLVGGETVQEKLTRWQDDPTIGLRATISAEITITTAAGQTELTPEQALCGLLADDMVHLEGRVALLYDQTNPDTAEGRGLDNVSNLRDARRRGATSTTVLVAVVGTPLADLSSVRVLHNLTQTFFRFPSTAVLSAAGTGSFTLTAEVGGPTQVAAADSGWTPTPANADIASVTAALDASVGADAEGDPTLRRRVNAEDGSQQTATRAAMLNAVRALPGVGSVTGIFADSPLPKDGVPGWHAEIVVEGGSDQEIADALDVVAHGVQAWFGTTTVTAASGNVVKFTRPTTVDVKMNIAAVNTGADVVIDAVTRPAVFALISARAQDKVNTEDVGIDVVPAVFGSIVEGAFTDSGFDPDQAIVSVTITAARLADPLSADAVGLSKRERGRLLAANVSGGVT